MAKKQTKKSGKNLGMIGCGTPDIMLRDRARKTLGKIEGVVGIQVKPDSIIVRVKDQAAADRLPKTFERRKVVAQIVGTITKQ